MEFRELECLPFIPLRVPTPKCWSHICARCRVPNTLRVPPAISSVEKHFLLEKRDALDATWQPVKAASLHLIYPVTRARIRSRRFGTRLPAPPPASGRSD